MLLRTTCEADFRTLRGGGEGERRRKKANGEGGGRWRGGGGGGWGGRRGEEAGKRGMEGARIGEEGESEFIVEFIVLYRYRKAVEARQCALGASRNAQNGDILRAYSTSNYELP